MSEITKVRQIIEIENYQDAVNHHLEAGWILLDTYKYTIGGDHGPSQVLKFVLGWTQDRPPPR